MKSKTIHYEINIPRKNIPITSQLIKLSYFLLKFIKAFF